jgi:outer membrane murein-binding lipoprotein Lpp
MRLVFAAAAVLLLVACATSPPVQEMSDARQALQAAIEAGAQERDPAAVERVERLLERAGERLDKGEYRRARQMAGEARQTARALLPDGESEPAPQ